LTITFLIDNHRLSVELAALAGIAARRTDGGAPCASAALRMRARSAVPGEVRECRAAQISAKATSASKFWTEAMIELPEVKEDGNVRKEWAAKARNHSRVASALPHSEGIAYKPPCGEIAMCPQVGRMGSIK
jgi:hypothetical protein